MNISRNRQLLIAGLVLLSGSAPLAADEGPVAHWTFASDVNDSSANRLESVNHGVELQADDPGKGASGAARFTGRGQYIEVPDADVLDFATGDFSIAVRVHTAAALDDLPGNILSKFDPQSRTGFQLSIDSRPGVTSSQSNARQVHFGIDNGRSASEWTDHGRLGEAVLIFGMAVHDNQLFAGTCVADEKQAGRVYRYDGETWTDCGAPDECNSVSSLAVYRGQLYVGVSKYRLRGSSLAESENPHPGGKVYRYVADGDWESCGALPETEAINGMVVFRDKMYASSMYAPAGFFRYEGGTDWTSCGTPDGKRVEALGVYNGHIYATGYDEGAVYRYDGESWSDMGQIEGATQTYGFAVHYGDLYVSEWPNAKVFRFDGPNDWAFAGRAGDELETMPLAVYNGKMYVGTLPTGEVYRFDTSDAGPSWTKVARLDMTPDVRYRRVWSMAVYQGRLFAGTLPAGRVHSLEVGRNVTYDQPLAPGWRHITAVKEGGQLRLYVDGELVSQSSRFDAADYDLSNDQPLTIGFGSQDYLNGRLSDLRIYSRALDPQEIQTLAGH